jgi:hypothetical protein
MILLPLFWDQYDSAQRMDGLDFGVRLATYAFTDEQMDAALAPVLSPGRAAAAVRGEAIRARDGLTHGADVIEQVARARTPRAPARDRPRGARRGAPGSLVPAGRAPRSVGVPEPLRLLDSCDLGSEPVRRRRRGLRGRPLDRAARGRRGRGTPRCPVTVSPGAGRGVADVRRMHQERGSTSTPRRRGAGRSAGFVADGWYAEDVAGERGITVDQTNESVVVGDRAMVKWARPPAARRGPRRAAGRRLAALMAAGFAQTPRPWGLLHWVDHEQPDAATVLLASIVLPRGRPGRLGLGRRRREPGRSPATARRGRLRRPGGHGRGAGGAQAHQCAHGADARRARGHRGAACECARGRALGVRCAQRARRGAAARRRRGGRTAARPGRAHRRGVRRVRRPRRHAAHRGARRLPRRTGPADAQRRPGAPVRLRRHRLRRQPVTAARGAAHPTAALDVVGMLAPLGHVGRVVVRTGAPTDRRRVDRGGAGGVPANTSTPSRGCGAPTCSTTASPYPCACSRRCASSSTPHGTSRTGATSPTRARDTPRPAPDEA